jgi:hypothetical protein
MLMARPLLPTNEASNPVTDFPEPVHDADGGFDLIALPLERQARENATSSSSTN